MKPAVRLVCLGRMPYLDALKVQHDVATKIKIQQKKGANPENTLILVEHTPVYTVGIRIKNYGVSEEDRLKKLGQYLHDANKTYSRFIHFLKNLHI